MLADDVKALRSELKLTVRALAEHLGVEIKELLSWEAGERFPTKRHVSLMEALRNRKDVSPNSLPARAGASDKSAAPLAALADPELWRVVRKLVAHPDLLAETAALAARYEDPIQDEG